MSLQAVGNWDGQKPVFRGCAGVKFAHGNTCKREMQIVEVTPGRPKVSRLAPDNHTVSKWRWRCTSATAPKNT